MKNRVILFVIFLFTLSGQLPKTQAKVQELERIAPQKILFVDTYANLQFEDSVRGIISFKSFTSLNIKSVGAAFTVNGELICTINDLEHKRLAQNLKLEISKIPNKFTIPFTDIDLPKNSSFPSIAIKVLKAESSFLNGKVLINNHKFKLAPKINNKVTELFCDWIRLNDNQYHGSHVYRRTRRINELLFGIKPD